MKSKLALIALLFLGAWSAHGQSSVEARYPFTIPFLKASRINAKILAKDLQKVLDGSRRLGQKEGVVCDTTLTLFHENNDLDSNGRSYDALMVEAILICNDPTARFTTPALQAEMYDWLRLDLTRLSGQRLIVMPMLGGSGSGSNGRK